LTFVITALDAVLGCLMVARRCSLCCFAALLLYWLACWLTGLLPGWLAGCSLLLFADIRLVIKQALFKPKPGY